MSRALRAYVCVFVRTCPVWSALVSEFACIYFCFTTESFFSRFSSVSYKLKQLKQSIKSIWATYMCDCRHCHAVRDEAWSLEHHSVLHRKPRLDTLDTPAHCPVQQGRHMTAALPSRPDPANDVTMVLGTLLSRQVAMGSLSATW